MSEALLHRVAEMVATHYRFSLADILRQDRHAPLVLARHVVCYLARTDLQMSYQRIGRWFERDHTTALHGVKKITASLPHAPRLAEEIAEFRRQIASWGDDSRQREELLAQERAFLAAGVKAGVVLPEAI